MKVNFTVKFHIETDNYKETDVVRYILNKIETIQSDEEANDALVDYIIHSDWNEDGE